MENEYDVMINSQSADYFPEGYEAQSQMYSGAEVQSEQTVPYTQTQQIFTQPVITQPVIAQPIYTQPVYTQPVIVQSVLPQEPVEPTETMYPAEPVYPVYPVQNYLPANEIKPERWQAPPILVFFALLLCFPIGLVLLLFFTKWGAFPKIFLTVFTLICIWFAYEIFAFYTSFDLPSLLNSIF